MSPPPLPLEVRAVTKRFPGGVDALRGVTFRIGDGERACLLGPNGAGKTTLIRLVTGALQATSGEVRVFGVHTHGDAFLEAKRRIGIVPQSPGMYRDFTCRMYLDFVRELYARGDTDEVIGAFGLADFVDRPMATLSGGQQRRLSIAAAVLPKPEVLLLDEPTAGLDPVATRDVHAYLREIMKGRTVLLCTHNLAEAEALCESAVILRSGQMLLHERIDALRRRTRPALALRSTQPVERLVTALTARGLVASVAGDEARVAVDDPQRDAPALLRGLLADGLDVFECRVVEPRLEQLFLDALGGEPDAA